MIQLGCNSKFCAHTYEVRWRLDYHGRPSRMGMWSKPGSDATTIAWMQPKEGLARAAIEAKHRETKAVVTIAECDGHEWIEFRWMAAAPVIIRSDVAVSGAIQGMTLVSSREKLHAYLDGAVRREPYEEGHVISHAWKF